MPQSKNFLEILNYIQKYIKLSKMVMNFLHNKPFSICSGITFHNLFHFILHLLNALIVDKSYFIFHNILFSEEYLNNQLSICQTLDVRIHNRIRNNTTRSRFSSLSFTHVQTSRFYISQFPHLSISLCNSAVMIKYTNCTNLLIIFKIISQNYSFTSNVSLNIYNN